MKRKKKRPLAEILVAIQVCTKPQTHTKNVFGNAAPSSVEDEANPQPHSHFLGQLKMACTLRPRQRQGRQILHWVACKQLPDAPAAPASLPVLYLHHPKTSQQPTTPGKGQDTQMLANKRLD